MQARGKAPLGCDYNRHLSTSLLRSDDILLHRSVKKNQLCYDHLSLVDANKTTWEQAKCQHRESPLNKLQFKLYNGKLHTH